MNTPQELTHYGVKGMKWGVRRVKKESKKSDNANVKKVQKEYEKEFALNKRHAELGKASTSLAKKIMALEEKNYGDWDEQSQKLYKKLYKKMVDNDDEMTKIEKDIGAKYINRLNEARLTDIKFTGSADQGKAWLKEAHMDFVMRGDGYIHTSRLLGKGTYTLTTDPQNKYIRPYNL